MGFFGKWKLLLTGLFAVLFFALDFAPLNNDFQQQASVVFLAFCAAHFTLPLFKKHFVSKTIAFDMGGVVTKGEFYTEEVTEMPGMRQLIERLSDNHKTALATNNNALAFQPFDAKFGFHALFDYVLVSGRVGVKKPDAAYFKKLVEMSGSKPGNIIFFDDTPENVEAAKKLGIKGIVFKSTEQCREALKGFGIRA